ncbi:Ig-like V-type domain-containing protein FAM187A isoform X1 [Empidonax traillii]|uniref:Ig-like V-type domain-containing protein FAM187A isoform X1 n=1 Tax=Empidonax traillii TaxID=164674 RepID=UPI000FFCF5F5|nr:Ig-like V-type domain-containing protein FAM187A isoform X1 [Empidonax traillii]
MGPSLLGATVLLCLVGALQAFAIEKKGDVFKKTACPAFLTFENVAYLADMTFELPCKCKPEEVSSVVWYFQKNLRGHETAVLTDFNGTVVLDSSHVRAGSDLLKRFSIRMFSLIVFRAQGRDSGHYLCGSKEGHFFYGYDVDVQPTERIAVAFLDGGQHVRDDYAAEQFSLFTTFWDWSGCDRCGVRGEQRRVGLCYVQSAQLSPRYRTSLPNVTSCGSRAVPAGFPPLLHLRSPEVAVRSCLAPCPPREEPEEGVQSISNIVYKFGEKPDVPRVPIQYHSQPSRTDLVIACPGARPEHTVGWDKDSLRLYRSQYLVGVGKGMRVFIDHGNHLHILRVRRRDRGTYFCWRDGQMVAGFRLSVTFPVQRRRGPADPESIFVMRAVGIGFGVIAGIFFLAHLGRCCWWALRKPAKL